MQNFRGNDAVLAFLNQFVKLSVYSSAHCLENYSLVPFAILTIFGLFNFIFLTRQLLSLAKVAGFDKSSPVSSQGGVHS